MNRPVLTIDLGAIASNWRALDAMSGAAVATGAAVKADGYGLGADVVARTLAQAGCETFFVATAVEAAALRDTLSGENLGGEKLGGDTRRGDFTIYVLNGATEGLEAMAWAKARPVLNARSDVEAALAFARRSGAPLPCALQIETGMNRLGMSPTEIAWLAETDLSPLKVELVMSHLACADDPEHGLNAEQKARFDAALPALLARFPEALTSLSATGGILLGRGYHYQMTRPGIGLYGASPFLDAQPVVTLEAPILRVWEIEAGETSGYGASFTAELPTRLATIPVGYADGVPRTLSSKGEARIGDVRVPFAGRVSMDLIVLDVTDAPAAVAGATVVLLDQAFTPDQMATKAGTIGYEILTSLGDRYIRRYKPFVTS